MLPNYQARSPFVLKHTTSWRASVASETLTGVTQSKIGDVSLLASERSERDTLRGNAIEISLYLFIYLFMGYVRPLFSSALLIT